MTWAVATVTGPTVRFREGQKVGINYAKIASSGKWQILLRIMHPMCHGIRCSGDVGFDSDDKRSRAHGLM
jgi:hypothetical protein